MLKHDCLLLLQQTVAKIPNNHQEIAKNVGTQHTML